MATKVLTNPKFPNMSIDIEFDSVYGGGTVKQFEKGKQPQSMVMGKKTLQVFLEETRKEGWS